MKPRVISLFSGVGTFDHGFHQAGWQTVHLCEWDPKAREVLAARFPGVPITNDVREVHGAELPDAECIMFGSPCQDLSVAGKRGGLEGERSGLFMEAVRIIREKREATNGQFPRFALWENVCGAFSSHGGKDFAAVLSLLVGGTVHVPGGGWRNAGLAFGPLGQCAWRVLDSQFFGVPQRRRRIFALTDFGGERAGEILFESEGVCGHPQAGRGAGQEVAGRPAIRPDRRSPGEGIAQTLTAAKHGSRFDAETETFIPVPIQGATGDGWPAKVAPTLGASWGRKRGNDQDFFSQGGGMYVPDVARCQASCNTRIDAETETLLPVPIQDGREIEMRQNGLGIGKPGDPAYTLVTLGTQAVAFQQNARDEVRLFGGDGQSVGALMAEPGMKQQNYIAFDYKASVQRDPMCGPISPTLEAQDKTAITTPAYRVRRLTPEECEALQAMPRGWTDVNGMADTHRYRFMGNGGTSFVLRWIAGRMGAVL